MLTGVMVPQAKSTTPTPVLDMRVSELLKCHAEILPLLVDYGFTPLNNPLMRKTLAPTITLAQALRLHPLPPDRERKLLARLEQLCTPTRADQEPQGNS